VRQKKGEQEKLLIIDESYHLEPHIAILIKPPLAGLFSP
jgi:hypothetical protein